MLFRILATDRNQGINLQSSILWKITFKKQILFYIVVRILKKQTK